MKKIAAIIAALAVMLTGTAALASDAVLYSDDDLGFSFEMPSDFEYYDDLGDESQSLTGAENIEKQPMYVGWDSNINVVYSIDDAEFDKMEARLPEGMNTEELDYYMFSDSDRKKFMKSLVDGIEGAGLDNEIQSTEWADYGGKLCLLAVSSGYSPEYELDYYQASLGFIYKRHFINITYTKFDIDGSVLLDDALEDFEDCFSTLSFNVVPSDKNAKLEGGIDWMEVLIWGISGALSAALITIIVVLINKSKQKKQRNAN